MSDDDITPNPENPEPEDMPTARIFDQENFTDDEPPVTGGRRRFAGRKKEATKSSDDGYTPPKLTPLQIEKKLRELLNTVGGVASIANPYDGAVIIANADQAAKAYAELARRHKKVKQAIEALEAGGVYGACVSVTLAMALPILANHNMLPPQFTPLAAMFAPPNANGNSEAE